MTQKNRKHGLKLVHIVFTVCLILILAPAIYFGWMLASTYMDSHSPVLGSRYENDLNPAITKDQPAATRSGSALALPTASR